MRVKMKNNMKGILIEDNKRWELIILINDLIDQKILETKRIIILDFNKYVLLNRIIHIFANFFFHIYPFIEQSK